MSSLAPGSYSNETITVNLETCTTSPILPGGSHTYYVGFILDYTDLVVEDSEANAFYWPGQQVTFTRLVNLTATGQPASYTYSYPDLTINVRVLNDGGAQANWSYLGYYLSSDTDITTSDVYLGNDYVSALAAGSYSDETISVNVAAHPGTWYVGFIIDFSFRVTEDNENDNRWYFTPSITIPLALPNAPILDSPADGATNVSINPRLTWINGGGGAADYYTVEVRDESYDLVSGNASNEWKDIGPLTPNMSYTWRVNATNSSGSSPWSDMWTFTTAPDADVDKIEDVLPQVFALHPNYPNPFNSETTIPFDLEKSEFVELKILDIQGKEITSLISEFKESGSYQYIWNAKDIPSGIYLYRLQTDNHVETRKLILQK